MNSILVFTMAIAMTSVVSPHGFSGTDAAGGSGKPGKPGKPTAPARSFYDFKVKALDGSSLEFSKYKGKKVLIVNTASKCGFTPQYAKLQALHKKMGDRLVILGFPANNFGSQEPGSNQEISTFCQKNYGVTFQMLEKVSVLPPDQCSLYHWLTHKEENGWNTKVPTWNFCKYLVNEDGKLTNFWESAVDPLGPEIAEALVK